MGREVKSYLVDLEMTHASETLNGRTLRWHVMQADSLNEAKKKAVADLKEAFESREVIFTVTSVRECDDEFS